VAPSSPVPGSSIPVQPGRVPLGPVQTVAPPKPSTATPTSRRRRPSGEPPPLPRQLNASGKWWLVLFGAMAVAWTVAFFIGRFATWVSVAEHRVLESISELRTPWLTTVMKVAGSLATSEALLLLWWASLIVLVFWRRWQHLIVWIGAMLLVQAIANATASFIQRPRPVGIEILGHWQGYATPSRPMAILALMLVSALYAVVPAGRLREIGKPVVAAVLALTMLSRLYLAQEAPLDSLAGIVIGVAIPLAAFRLFAPNSVFPVVYKRGRTAHLDLGGPRRDAIERALHDQLGVITIEIKPFGLAGSGGSTPMRIKVKGDPDTYLFGKLYAKTHLRSDRWYKLGRTLMYGRLEDEKAFNTVRRLVQYEDYMLRVLRDGNLPVPQPYGIVEITPEREYVLVTEFFDGAQEVGEAEVDDAIIDQGLDIVRRLWEAGLAHRDIKPANLLVRDGRVLLIDSAFGEVRPSPWRQAVDLGNMMLVLALRTDPERVYERAKRMFTVEEITEAFAATRGLTMPSELRRMLRQQGRDLHAEFIALLPEPPHPIRIQRWSMRRMMLITATIIGAVLASLVVVELLKSPL
jgi:tRNA A-37 threonylcarbamoyl transferase component Bud32/membrane-associated phospholipid phosphatase